MGKRGPRPTPTALKVAHGTFRKDRHGELDAQPQPDKLTTVPKPPKALKAIGRVRWKEDGQRLIDIGVLTVMDLPALEIYCLAWDEVAECEQTLKEGKEYVELESGRICPHPAKAARIAALDRIRRYQQEFGMTPSARTGVVVSKKSDGGKIAARKRG